MSRWEFKLPDIGEGVTEGEIVNWLIKEGDSVEEDQPMVEVMTDKATVTITAPRSGRITETRGKVGETVPVHAVLVVFDLGGASGEAKVPPTHRGGNGKDENGHASRGSNGTPHASAKEEGPAATAVGDIREDLPGMSVALAKRGGSTARTPTSGRTEVSSYYNDKPLATPATRQMARDLGVDLKRVQPTGPQGRTTKADVLTFTRSSETPQPISGPEETVRTPLGVSALEERIPFAGLRRRIATKMQTSKQTAAHFTFVEECDVSALKALRGRLNALAEREGAKLTFMPFIVKAVVAALKKHPMLNSTLDETRQELVIRRYFNIGIATATESGLIVPVIKNAERKSLVEISREIERLAGEARAGKSKLEDLSGSTFTITSLGAQGGLFATPIINFPEVGILGIHQMKQKPVVREGEITIGDVMLVSLSFDHRIVDGHVGAAFAYEIIHYLENPDRLFLDMA